MVKKPIIDLSKASVVAVIPARGGSRRLPRKNIYPIWGKPMLYWGIRACQESRFINGIFVSTEDKEIAEMAKGFGAKVIDRPVKLADHLTYKQDVIVHAVKTMNQKPDLVVSLQPNSPQVSAPDMDGAIEKLVKFDRNEIFSVNEDLIQNAAFRIMRHDFVFETSISWDTGVFITHYMDVHTLEDAKYLEENDAPPSHYQAGEIRL